MAEHIVEKPERLLNAYLGVLAEKLRIPMTFNREGVEKYQGAQGDAYSVKVPGILPAREYGWRNDRSTPIEFDEYAERRVTLDFGGDAYSAVKLTDEQKLMDLPGWGPLISAQTAAVGRKVERSTIKAVKDAPYEVVIGNAEQNLRGAFIEARRVLNAFNVDEDTRWFIVGSDYEAALLNDEKLNLAQNVGDSEAESALRNAVIGKRYGFNIVVDPNAPADTAFAYSGTAFGLALAAPPKPSGAPYGASASYDGLALSHVCDYDTAYQQDRSVIKTFFGMNHVKDPLLGYDEATDKEFITTGEYFVRGIKLQLDGASNYPAASGEVAKASGVSDAKVWTPTGFVAETDPANV